jgi:hypothetical protein
VVNTAESPLPLISVFKTEQHNTIHIMYVDFVLPHDNFHILKVYGFMEINKCECEFGNFTT